MPSLRSPLVLGSAAAVIVAALVVAAVMSKPRPAPAPTETPAPPSPIAAAPPPPCQKLDATVNALTPRQKLAQLLMVGVKNLADAQAVVREQEVGGIFITSWTDYSMLGEPLAALTQEPRPLPLAVSVDEEGGRVQRLRTPWTEWPPMRHLGERDDLEATAAVATALLQMGMARATPSTTVARLMVLSSFTVTLISTR